MATSNLLADGFEGIDYISNLGDAWGNPDFPDSLAAQHLGGSHTLLFSGRDFYGINVYDIASFSFSGFKGPRNPLIDQTGFYWNPGSGFGAGLNSYIAGSDGLWPYKWFYTGKGTRFHWDTRETVNGGPMGNRNNFTWQPFNTGTPNLRSIFGLQNSVPIAEEYKFVSSNPENNSFYTNQQVNIIDLISEGPIEGLVSGTYFYSVSGKNPNDIGYTSAQFVPYTTSNASQFASLDPTRIVPPEARSIFWNDTPVATQQGFFNFRYINYKYDYGNNPNTHTISNPIINLYEDRYHYDGYQVDQYKYPVRSSTTASIGERLYGPSFFSGVVSGVAPVKKYYVYNTDVEGIKINIRVDSLYSTIASGTNAGVNLKAPTEILVRLWRVFSDRSETVAGMNRVQGDPLKFSADRFKILGKIVNNPSLIHYTFWIRPYAEQGFFYEVAKDQIGWAVEVNKLSAEFNQSLRKNTTYVDSITEICSNRFTYPGAALIYNNFDAKYFGNIPTRKYKTRLLKVKIPINYDPITKNYSGAWNGQFKLAWTDNPAWCFYDLITNNRFGLGKYIDSRLVDKWSLFEVSQYCDQLVPDGFGGLEPRFTCNVMIQAKEEAYKVINDMASIFNGLVYYSAGQIFTNQDRPKDPIYIFNNSNVVNGEFNYSNSAKRARRSVALIRFNDENNNYDPAVEYVEDKTSLLKYGIREVEVTAFGATKRSQARRLGKWFLTSENLETETINFTAGLEGSFLKPGDIINVYDQNRRNNVFAGRTLSLNSGSCILDIAYNSSNLFAFTGAVNPISLSILTPTDNLNLGTYLGDLYATGFNITSSGISGLNSSFFRKSQIQNVIIYNPKNYISEGTGNFTGYISFSFPTGLNSSGYSLPQNTVWTIDFDAALYSGSNFGLDNRSPINNPQNLLYPGWYLEGYLNDVAAYRVVNIEEKENQNFTISALEYVPQKYTDIITGESLISVPVKNPAPTIPTLNVGIIYRDISGNFSANGNNPPYSSNQNGINSIYYQITPPSNSGVVTQYNIYRNFEQTFNINTLSNQFLFDIQSNNLRNQNFILPIGSTSGNIPVFFTPTGTGTWYIGALALNAYGERSPLATGAVYLANQAAMAVIEASGINVVGGTS